MSAAPLHAALDLVSALLWALTYVLIVRRSLLDRVSGVPLSALAPALAWELHHGFVRPTPGLAPFVVPAWLALDCAVLAQLLRHGPRSGWFHVRVAAALLGAFALLASFARDFDDPFGVWSGFAVNAVMSLGFVAMLERRPGAGGQSLYIALAKLLGTAATTPHALALQGARGSLRLLVIVALGADLVYAALLHRRLRDLGLRPWARL